MRLKQGLFVLICLVDLTAGKVPCVSVVEDAVEFEFPRQVLPLLLYLLLLKASLSKSRTYLVPTVG